MKSASERSSLSTGVMMMADEQLVRIYLDKATTMLLADEQVLINVFSIVTLWPVCT